MRIDHVTIAGSSLATLEAIFEKIGMKTEYGGPHSNGVTHMSLLGFDDGSYIELISTLKPGTSSSVWGKHIAEDGGPCAWAVQVDDIHREVSRVRNLGLSAIGPQDYNRRRPDGVLVEWQLGFIGDKEPGATLPFLIRDKTPREYRVRPSPSVSTSGQKKKEGNGNSGDWRLNGVEKVILGVRNLEEEASLFRRLYDWSEPVRGDDFDSLFKRTTVASFDGSPVVLAAPENESTTWLEERLQRFGDSPCAFLIGTADLAGLSKLHNLSVERVGLDSRSVAWIPSSKLNGIRLGFIG